MDNQPPSQEQRAQKTKQQSRTSERPPSAKTHDEPNALSAPELNIQANAKRSTAMRAEERIATAGLAGERNLVLKRTTLCQVDSSHGSHAFAVSTLPGHGLEVIMEQLSYKKTYTGTDALQTQLIPVAPIGTRGRVIAHDITTGETLEEPWTWHLVGGGGSGGGQGVFSWLWDAFRRSLWKSD